MEPAIWDRYNTLFWVLIGISIYVCILIIIYVILRFAFHKKLGSLFLYLSYLTIALPMWPLVEIIRFAKRKKWLIKSGLKEGQTYLEEGIGVGTSPLLASRIVGNKGIVYALDNNPLHIAVLNFRSKIRRIKNIKLIFSDATETGLEDRSIDTIFICDAFHEFPDKKNTVIELHRILKPGGSLSIWDENEKYTSKALKIVKESKIFKLIERDKMFIRFAKHG